MAVAMVALVSVVALSACGADNGESSGPGSIATSECRHVERLKDLHWDLAAPRVFAYLPSEVGSLLEERRRLLDETLSTTGNEELRTQIVAYLEAHEVTDVARVRLLTDDGALMNQVGWAWDRWAFDQRDLVSQVEHDAFAGEQGNGAFDLLEAACVHPELAVPLQEDPGSDPPAGTIVFKELGPDAGGGLMAVSVTGGTPVELEPPTGWDALQSPWVDTGTGEILAIASRDDGAETAVVEGTVATGFHELFVPPEPMVLSCASRTADGILLATARLARSATVVLSIDQTGQVDELELGLTNPRCAQPAGEGLVTTGGHDVREFGEVTYLAGEDLREATSLSDGPKCNELLGDVDAVSGEVLMSRTCADAGESGMYLGAINGRSATQLLPGRVGAPSFSPDGRWVTFGYGPLGSNLTESARIWVMRTDRTGLVEITDSPSSFPVWTNDEL